jgi:hypothetical protein
MNIQQSVTAILVTLAATGLGCAQGQPNPVVPAPMQAHDATVAQLGAIDLQVIGLGAYRVAALVEEVDSLRVTVTDGAGIQLEQKMFSVSQMVVGKGRATLASLPAGQATVKVEALDAAGDLLGENQSSVEVVAGQTAVVSVHIKLKPTEKPNANGNVAANVTLEDGDETPAPIETAAPDPVYPELE